MLASAVKMSFGVIYWWQINKLYHRNCGHCLCFCCGLVLAVSIIQCTVYPKKYAHRFVVPCFVVVMQSFITNSHEVFIHIHQGRFAGTGAIVRLPQCQ